MSSAEEEVYHDFGFVSVCSSCSKLRMSGRSNILESHAVLYNEKSNRKKHAQRSSKGKEEKSCSPNKESIKEEESRSPNKESKEEESLSPNKESKEEESCSLNKELYLGKAFKLLMASLDNNSKVLEQTADILQRRLPESRGHPSALDISSSCVDNTKDYKRDDKVVVELKLTFLKIVDIDTVNQQFEAEILVRAKWKEPLLKDQTQTYFDPSTMWTPKLLVMNLDGDFIINKTTFKVVHDTPGYDEPLVVWLWRFKGFFQENLELQHFPIDVQDLTISITSERSEDDIDLVQDSSALSTVNTETFMDIQEWDIYEHVETYENKSTLEYVSSVTHPIFHAQCRVKRKIGYFMWNIVFIVGLITVLAFTTFSIEPYSADRLAVAITLLLTSVTFKLIVKQSLPTISYLTYLDLYVLAALVFLGLASAQHAAVKYLADFKSSADVKRYDRYSLFSLAFVFVAFHLIFAMFVLLTAIKRRKVMEEKDKLFKAKRRFMRLCGSKTEKVITTSMSKSDRVATKI